MLPFDFVVRVEGAAQHRRHAQDGEELGRDALRPRVRRLATFRLQPEGRPADGGELLKWLLHRAPVEIRLRRRVAQSERRRVLGVLLVDDAEAIVFVEGQPTEDDGVHDGEDGGACADAKRQHRQRDDGKSARGAEGAEGVLQVLNHGRLDGQSPAAVGKPGLSRFFRLSSLKP